MKRRFALKNEAYRHYIDIDHWGDIEAVPRDFKKAIFKYGEYICIDENQDSTLVELTLSQFDELYDKHIYEERFSLESEITEGDTKCIFFNRLVEYGVLPYFLEHHYQNLVKAFSSKSLESILKLSADMGHYLGDAHVPLHTTENYNGQLTDQLGIHAFWESRIPELFADDNYDFLVGKSEYIVDKQSFFWEIILGSHALLEEVLANEKRLSQEIPKDKQYCYDERYEHTVWTQCPEFAKVYHESMSGMVEDQMRQSILSLGSIWYSAWIDAGQPSIQTIINDIDTEQQLAEKKKLDDAFKNNEIYGRTH